MTRWTLMAVILATCSRGLLAADPTPLQIAVFNVDATPPIGSPVAYAPARKILAPLSARGIVLLGGDKPVVLCAVDWIGIANGGQDVWKQRLAEAAGTTPDHVAVHALHQHDGARCDFTAEAMLEACGLGGKAFDNAFANRTIAAAASAIRSGVAHPVRVTHIGVGKGLVEKVASNRRILGPDGKVAIVRWSRMTDPRATEAPEGTIDPYVRVVSFFDGDRPIVALTYYATHPQSYYGKGDVNPEFVGMARSMREQATGDLPHVHFNGAGGNVTAGKYNDGSEPLRPILASRLAEGMKRAFDSMTRQPITAAEVQWRTVPVKLPLTQHLSIDKPRATLSDPTVDAKAKISAASDLAWLERNAAGRTIDIGCLRLGTVRVLHMPGELFVEYQLVAQAMKPDATVCMAAYGEYGPGYIGTQIAYSQGGYETGPTASLVAPTVETVLMNAMRELLRQ